MKAAKWTPWLVFALALTGAGAALHEPAKVRGFDLDAFMRLPVLEGGRIKPLDSVARNSLLMLRGQQSYVQDGRTTGPGEWLLDMLFRPDIADTAPVFVVNDPEVLGLIGLRQTADRYFPFSTFVPHLEEIEKQARAARAVDEKQRSRYQGAVVNLFERLLFYERLENTVQLAGGGDLNAEEKTARLEQLAAFRPLPGQGADAYRSVGQAIRAGDRGEALASLLLVGSAWQGQDSFAFNGTVKDFAALHRKAELGKASHEQLFNRAQPFYLGMILYLLALLVLFASWLWKPRILQPTAFALLAAGALVHTAGLAVRIVLQGRPPVTNLYSSAIFVGWAAVILGIILERIYRRGFGTAVAAASGFVSLIVAHHLLGDGDTMEMMRAVLDSNIWLATHVVTITIGYSGTFLAGAIAIGYTLRRQLIGREDREIDKTLVSMAYGIICFALFFSFVGTVLGGIWADQSWGRFWGWDPKENGALLIVLWNAIILHARWGGFVRERGIMAMAIFGNIITSLSWFGVNMLGVGLHSYGFMESAFWALSAFIASQLVLMALCLLPKQFWRGHAGKVPTLASGERAAFAKGNQ
jgi:ABC-type transport system involved in cytochrome c biogenesis permease subunit